MASVNPVEEGTAESSSAPALPSDHKDESSTEVPKDGDTNGDSKVGQKQGASSSTNLQQVQVPVPQSGNMVLEKEQTRQESAESNPKIKDSSGPSPEQDASVPVSNNIKPTDSQESLAANPQTTKETSDALPPLKQDASVPPSNNIKPTDSHESVAANPQTTSVQDNSDALKQDTSVPSSNIANSADSQKEESKLSPSVAEANSNSVSQQPHKESPERVQENHISDKSVPQQDTLLASTAKPEMLDSAINDVPESITSHTSEAKPNRSLESSTEDGSASSEQAQANEVGIRSAFPHHVKQTKAYHQRRPSDVVSRAMASAAMGTAAPSSDVKQTIVHHHRKSSDDVSRALAAAAIDTAAPIESVKDAVSKFGGITNWKAHKVQTVERRKLIEEELEKVQEEIPVFKKQSEAAEESKKQVLKELDSTKRLIEELKLNLERAQMEEHQAKQDSELAQLRVEEMEQGIADEASVAAKAQFEVTKARQLAVVSDLESLKIELETLRKDYASLMSDRDAAIKNAEDAVSSAKKVERTVEKLTIELMSTKESLESAHAAHLEAEEHRTGAATAQQQDIINQEKELKQAEEEVEKLNQQILSAKDLKSKLDTASALLLDLKAELAAYMALKENPEAENSKGNLEGQEKNTHRDIQAAIASANRNHEEVKLNIEKATEEVNSLKAAATSLKSQLESEKSALDTVRQREGMASVTVASIEAELNRTKAEISLVQMKERGAREKMTELPQQLKKAAEEADQAKSLARVAQEELHKAKEEVDQLRARISTTESKILAAKKEIEAAKASEKLALATLNALQETKAAAQTPNGEDSPSSITLSLEEYYELNKKAHEAEVQANTRVTEALTHIEVAKESELRSLSKLEEATFELATKKEALAMARQKAETANEGKLSIEQELRKWRAEHEQQRRSNESTSGTVTQSPRQSSEGRKGSANPNDNPVATIESTESKKIDQGPDAVAERSPKANEASNTETDTSESKSAKKKKRSIFPRFFMFLGRKKSHHHKGH